jgi:hypothetical protein
LKEVSNYIPYVLEIKEAADALMIVKDFWALKGAYD